MLKLFEKLPKYQIFFFLNFGFYLFILFMALLGLRFCARAFSSCAMRGHSSLQCAGLSLSRPLLLRSTGSRRAGSAIVAHGPSRSVACGIFPDQGSNPCPLHWQADSQPLRHQGSPESYSLIDYWDPNIVCCYIKLPLSSNIQNRNCKIYFRYFYGIIKKECPCRKSYVGAKDI